MSNKEMSKKYKFDHKVRPEGSKEWLFVEKIENMIIGLMDKGYDEYIRDGLVFRVERMGGFGGKQVSYKTKYQRDKKYENGLIKINMMTLITSEGSNIDDDRTIEGLIEEEILKSIPVERLKGLLKMGG